MKASSLLIILVSAILFIACEEHTQTPALPQLRAEKITYNFDGGFSYRALQYDETGKVKGLISGVTYVDDGTFENTYEVIYEGNTLKKILSRDATIWSFEYAYGKKGELSETKVLQDSKLKEFYAFSYDTEGHLISEITWNSSADNETLLPVYQRKFAYDSRHNVVEIQQLMYDVDDFKLVSTIVYKDFDDKVNSEHLFMNNLHHPFVRFCKNNPRNSRLTNANGTSAEQNFAYEYNSHGHVTKRSIENSIATIDFEYREIK